MKIILLFFAILSFSACNSNIYYKQTSTIADHKWDQSDLKNFEFEIDNNEAYYDLILEIDHSVDFKFENIYVNINTLFPNGEEVKDEVSLQLADHLDQWQGKCNSKNCVTSILLQNNVYFKEKGNHKITIEQYNRENPLEGINSLTLKIVEL